MVGVGASKPARSIREAVTTMSSTEAASSGAPAYWAWTEVAQAISAMALQ